MKLDNKFVTQGIFAVGDQAASTMAGTLEINELGGIFLDSIHKMGMEETQAINLTGETSELGKVILLDCFEVSSSYAFSREFKRQKFLCNKLICVSKNHIGYDVKSKKMTFEIEDLEKWLAKPIVEHDSQKDQSKIIYSLPENETIDIGDGLSVTFTYKIKISTGNFYESSEVKSKALAVFESKDEIDIDIYIAKAVILSNLVSFALDSVCTIKDSFYGENKQNKVYYSTANHHKKKKEINLINYIFTLKHVKTKRKELVKNWFLIADKIRPTISLYNQFKAREYKYYDAAFLSLCQAVEALHRRTCDDTPMERCDYTIIINEIIEKAGEEHRSFLERKLSSGNEYSFRLRLELMLGVCWSKEKIEMEKKKITRIIDARNFLTHYPKSKERKFYCLFSEKSEEYVFLLESILISYILFLISNDKQWVVNIMNWRNQLKHNKF